MHRPTPLSLARVVPAVILIALAWSAAPGCKKDEPAPPPVESDTTKKDYQGISIEYPKDWKASDDDATKGLIVEPPPREEDENYPASIYFAVQEQPAGADLGQTLERAFQDAFRSTDFILKDKQIVNHPNGFKYARLEFTKRSEGSGTNIPLTLRELRVPIGTSKRLFVQASAATGDWARYEPQFSKVIDSIKLP